VTPAVVAPELASVPVMCAESEADSLVAPGAHETSDNNRDQSAAMLSKPPVRVWEWRRSGDPCQIRSVRPKEARA
jgi:hypothetical protein